MKKIVSKSDRREENSDDVEPQVWCMHSYGGIVVEWKINEKNIVMVIGWDFWDDKIILRICKVNYICISWCHAKLQIAGGEEVKRDFCFGLVNEPN